MKGTKLAVIVGNRDFFPDALVTEARQDILAVFDEMGIEFVMLAEEDTNLGGVKTWEDAQKCAALFKANADEIDGILVALPNFGDEKGVAKWRCRGCRRCCRTSARTALSTTWP